MTMQTRHSDHIDRHLITSRDQAQPVTAVKMIDAREGRVGGYLVVWGDATTRDLQGEYFTPETELGLTWYDRRPVLYHHGLDGNLKAAVIGQIETLQIDEVGVWAEAQLDLRQRYVQVVYNLIERGLLSWSSGSLPHLVAVANDGHIKRWPIVEGSLTPTPAEPRRTEIHTIKSAYAALGLDTRLLQLDDDSEALHERPALPLSSLPSLPSEPLALEPASAAKGHSMLNNLNQTATRKQLPINHGDATNTIAVSSEFDALNASDLLHGYMILRAAKGFRGVSERYANALAHKLHQSGAAPALKANELAYSTQTGFGDEWVPELWSQQIWQKARTDNTILPLFRAIEMPSNPFELPVEGTDPQVYYVGETTEEAHLTLGSGNPVPDSKIGSGKVPLVAKKLALRVGFSTELVEDSIIPVLNIYREQAMRALADAIDHVLLNGDTETGSTGNINSDHTAPTAGSPFLAMDGIRKLALASHDIDMSNATPTLVKLREARFDMPTRYAARPNDLAWIVDGNTYARLLAMDEFLTMDKAGPLATAQTGQIGYVDGIPVFVSAEMPLTEADGKVGGGTNNRGTAVCVYRPGWFVGYRRRIAVNVDYLPYYDSYQLTATVRLAFASYDNDVAATLFNIAV